jgi:hypothetical protein
VGKEKLADGHGLELQSSAWKATLIDLTNAEKGTWRRQGNVLLAGGQGLRGARGPLPDVQVRPALCAGR